MWVFVGVDAGFEDSEGFASSFGSFFAAAAAAAAAGVTVILLDADPYRHRYTTNH